MSAKSSRHRGLRLATLMGLVAIIALGLASYRVRVGPWLALRRGHPDSTTVADLFTAPDSKFSCTGCHQTTAKNDVLALANLQGRCALNAGRNVNGTARDCRACHAR